VPHLLFFLLLTLPLPPGLNLYLSLALYAILFSWAILRTPSLSILRFLFLLWLWFSYGYLAFCIYRTNATDNIAIEGRNLNFSITTRQGKVVPILQDCSLRIPSGQFWMLLGPNGCGKSTLLKVYQVLPYHFFSFL
jgi:ABC-type multidrug transport system fused ATPase/permease subunit